MGIFIEKGITAEIIMLIVSIMMISFIIMSKPDKTPMLKMVYGGFTCSVIAIVSNLGFLYLSQTASTVNLILLWVCYIIFVLAYTCILDLIFVYIDFLSYTRRAQVKLIKKMVVVYTLINLTAMLYPLFSGSLYTLGEKSYLITEGYNYHIYCGIAMGIICIFTVLSNKKTVSPIVVLGAAIFITGDICMLIAQLLNHNAIFLSATYVLAFVVFFILFHSNAFNEVSGCQNSDSFFVRIEDAVKQRKRFVIVTVIFPALQKRDFYDNTELLDYCASSMCREIERANKGVNLYRHNIYTYSVFCEETKSDTSEKLIKKITEVLSLPVFFNGVKIEARYKMIIMHDSVKFSCADNIKRVIAYEKTRFFPNLENEIIDVDEKEIDIVKEKDKIEQLLFDIRNCENLDDPRVLCYAQPIYCIQSNTFKTAEALMRLELDGEMIFPDKFIPVAEMNGCIHSLTLIILNKVCKFIKEIEGSYKFEAITVNCSTVELDDRNLCRELKKIIQDNGVDPKRIRLEITESFDVTRYENVLYNMEKLKEFGVDFYLDDFGTGYANLERIVSYPFHTIKFDKNILYKAIGDERADAVLDSTVKLFQENGFHTIVEGVEDESQSDYVKEKGFGHIQGYMYSRPMAINELKNYFEHKVVDV